MGENKMKNETQGHEITHLLTNRGAVFEWFDRMNRVSASMHQLEWSLMRRAAGSRAARVDASGLQPGELPG